MDGGVRQGLNGEQRVLVEAWRGAYQAEHAKYRGECLRTGVKGYKELSLFTFVGFAGGLGLGAVLDALGFSASAAGEWLVRTISGEGEDISEGLWVLRSRMRRKKAEAQERAGEEEQAEEELEEEGLVWFEEEAAEAYGAGKVAGMVFPWAVDAVSAWRGWTCAGPKAATWLIFTRWRTSFSRRSTVFATTSAGPARCGAG